jgi:tetratricopeptide (TPR) repeat protein
LRQLSPEPGLDDNEGSREEGGGTHHYPTDDPSQQIEDVIQKTIDLLCILRAEDQPSLPFLDTVVSLERLSNQMLDLGMHEDARQTYCQGICMYRACIQESSLASGLDARFAQATIGLCAALQQLGETEEALNCINEAVLVYRFLSKQSHLCYDYKAELSIALNNMANYIRDSGKALAALPVIEEAISIREELASTTLHLYELDLAVSLLNAATCYSKLPYLHRQALDVAERAVDITRKLVLEAPGRYAAHFGASLHNRANCLMALWRNRDAYIDIREAVEIRWKLASSRPDVYSGGLVRSLAVAKLLATLCEDVPGVSALLLTMIFLLTPLRRYLRRLSRSSE